jgi:hypothetical protein
MGLAGWLFADLLLVLALLALGGQADPLAAKAAQKPHPSPSASSSPKPKPKPSPTGPRSVVKARYTFKVSGTEASSVIGQIRQATAGHASEQAAFVLTFGGTQAGTAYARKVNGLLHRARPAMFNQDTATEDFLNLNSPANTAELWVYYYTSAR